MNKNIRICLLLALALFTATFAYSTHLKAGEIVVKRLSGTQFQIQLIIYTDSTSVIGFGVDEPDATLKFSDGTTMKVPRDVPGRIYIGNGTYKNVYTFVRQFNNSTYTISYQRDNRNGGILNMNDSGNTPFYLETVVRVSPFIGTDNLPSLLIPPVDLAAVGEPYTYNPGAFDPEGDSLSFEFTVPKQNVGVNVVGYQHPNLKPVPAGVFTLDPRTGDILWDAPVVPGYYNFSFIIREWRNGQVIGSIVRDMQIEVKDTKNKPPVLKFPKDTCIVAGSSLSNVLISATDPDNHKIHLTSESGVYSLSSSPGSFALNAPNPQSSPATGFFNWTTNCLHVRDQPYQVIFIAQDVPAAGKQLFDVRSWNIRVMAPAPQGLNVENIPKGFQLNWDPYTCTSSGKMEIYRLDCDSTEYIPEPCEAGIPGGLGFRKIGEVLIGTTAFQDTTGINPGSFYCYRIVAVFPSPRGGKSYPSEEACSSVNSVPVPTHASVVRTDSVNGKIMVKWTQPHGLDQAAYPGPYEYRLFRGTGIAGTDYVLVASLNNLADTMVVDSLLNTKDLAYNYKLEFYYTDASGPVLEASGTAGSSVFLKSSPGNGQVHLFWTYQTPWNNSELYHRIYRKLGEDGMFELYDSVMVNGNPITYTDIDVSNGDTACYYVETQGLYCSENLPPLLLNLSQVVCETPRDTNPPCPPMLFGPAECIEDGVKQLTIYWTPDRSVNCNKDIKGYNVYFAEHEGDEFQLLASNVQDTFYVDTDHYSLAGCYAVTAANFYGAESGKSNSICVDLCVYYELPNLISPNRDNMNDLFRPFPVPKNVEQVKFSVYNRWGKRIYYSEEDIFLNWEGIASDGSILPSGIYFFNAEVIYKRRLRREDRSKELKGWIHIIRKEERGIQD